MISQTQIDVDYVNEAQMRVCADTLLLEKKTTFTIPANQRSASLPTDVVRVYAVYQGAFRLDQLMVDEMVCETSAAYETNVSQRSVWAVIGDQFTVTPIPKTDLSVTIIYAARSAPYQSDSELEVTDEAENLVERLVSSYKLQDDGQPERAAAELQSYESDARLYKNHARSRSGAPRRMLTPGYDLHP